MERYLKDLHPNNEAHPISPRGGVFFANIRYRFYFFRLLFLISMIVSSDFSSKNTFWQIAVHNQKTYNGGAPEETPNGAECSQFYIKERYKK